MFAIEVVPLMVVIALVEGSPTVTSGPLSPAIWHVADLESAMSQEARSEQPPLGKPGEMEIRLIIRANPRVRLDSHVYQGSETTE